VPKEILGSKEAEVKTQKGYCAHTR